MPWVSREPDAETKLLVDDFNTFRGGYLSSFAQIEFTVGRLLSRFNATSPFKGDLEKVRFKFEARLDAFESFLNNRQELATYTAQGESLCSKIRDTYDLRNFFAHGIVRYDAQTKIFTVRRILPEKSNPWREISIDIHADEIAFELSKMSLLTQEFMYFARDISEAFHLKF